MSFFTRYLGGFIVDILTLGIVASLLKGADNSVGSILVFLVGLAFVALFVVLSWRSHQAAKTQPQAVQPVQPVQPSVS